MKHFPTPEYSQEVTSITGKMNQNLEA